MPKENTGIERIKRAKDVMLNESASIRTAALNLDENFSKAVSIILEGKRKIVVTGIGKSGHQAKRIAATFSSTGTPAAFLHPSEAVHGDLGIHELGDPVIFLSNSGSTPELIYLEPIFRTRKSKIIGILGKTPSLLSEKVDVVINATVKTEADPLGIVPTSSCSVAGAVADALASVVMKEKNFTKEDYALTHPAGQLGRNLLLTVGDVMHSTEKTAVVKKDTNFNQILIKMTEYPLGAACVVENNILVGIITDGDIRRILQKSLDTKNIVAENIMNQEFIYTKPGTRLGDALKMMEERDSKVSVLPVVLDENKKLCGLVRLHDIYCHE